MGKTAQPGSPDAQLFRDAFNASPIGIVVETMEGQPLYVNPAFCSFLGFSEEELHGKHCVDFSPPEDAAKDWALFQQLRAGSIEHYQLDKRYFRQDGSLVWGRLTLSLLNSRPSPLVIAMVEDITDKKRTEEALRESEERFRVAQQVSRVGTFERDFRTGLLTWTSEVEALYGLSPGGIGNTLQDFEELIHPGDRAGIMNLIRHARETGEPTDAEWRVIWPDGSLHWIAGRWQVFKDESGNPARGVGVNIDITERKQTENRLREYERVVEGVEEFIVVIDREHRFLMANHEFLKRRNLTSAEVVGRFVRDLYEQDFYDNVVKPKLEECFRGNIVRFDVKRVYPQLGERDLLAAFYPVSGKEGVDRAVCVLHDITERKRVEQVLLEANRTLEAQTALLQSGEELLRVFVKNVPAAVAMLDRDMHYLHVSDRWCTDYFHGTAEIIGHSHYEIFPDMPERWKDVHRRALEGETLRADEDRWDGQDGRHWARWEVRPWRAADGAVGGILILAEDITRRKQMEEELSCMSRKLIESQEQERSRIGRELHDDINQQLALLAIDVEQLRQRSPAELNVGLTGLKERVTAIAADVQSISHQLHSPQLEILGIVGAIRGCCREFAAHQKVAVDFTHDHIPQDVSHEVSLCLFRVLQEALHNAVKHSNVRHYEVNLGCSANELHLTVSDRGTGFNAEVGMTSGGLGLVSMRERVRLINGTITVDSEPKRGTSIHVRVPTKQVSAKTA